MRDTAATLLRGDVRVADQLGSTSISDAGWTVAVMNPHACPASMAAAIVIRY
ncbi:MAG TPA: hypothetical protein VF834_24410 [Streptosporangiaceae bacterium]